MGIQGQSLSYVFINFKKSSTMRLEKKKKKSIRPKFYSNLQIFGDLFDGLLIKLNFKEEIQS